MGPTSSVPHPLAVPARRLVPLRGDVSLSLRCGEEKLDPLIITRNDEGFAKLEKKLADLERNRHQVWKVEDDHGVLKVNVVLRPRTQDLSEVKRLSLNTLFDLEMIVRTDLNLGALSYEVFDASSDD